MKKWIELINEKRENPTIKAIDVSEFPDTGSRWPMKECYETLWAKLVEMTDRLYYEGAIETRLEVNMARNIAMLYEMSHTGGGPPAWATEVGKFYLGTIQGPMTMSSTLQLNIHTNIKWRVNLDDNLPHDRVEIESAIGKAVFYIMEREKSTHNWMKEGF